MQTRLLGLGQKDILVPYIAKVILYHGHINPLLHTSHYSDQNILTILVSAEYLL